MKQPYPHKTQQPFFQATDQKKQTGSQDLLLVFLLQHVLKSGTLPIVIKIMKVVPIRIHVHYGASSSRVPFPIGLPNVDKPLAFSPEYNLVPQ